MNLKTLLTAALALIATPVLAADLGGPKTPTAPVIAAVEPAQSYNWTGTYAGAHVGFLTDDTGEKLAGLHLGYRHQAGQFVVGLEGAATMGITDIKHSSADDVMWTVAGTVGFALDRLMIYGKAGYALADALDGFTYGAGISYAMTDRVLIGLELMRTDFGSLTNGVAFISSEMDTATARVSLRF